MITGNPFELNVPFYLKYISAIFSLPYFPEHFNPEMQSAVSLTYPSDIVRKTSNAITFSLWVESALERREIPCWTLSKSIFTLTSSGNTLSQFSSYDVRIPTPVWMRNYKKKTDNVLTKCHKKYEIELFVIF